MQLNRLKMAIQYRQKKVSLKVEKFGHFKAHCHVLSFEWMEVLLTLHLQLSFHIIPICIVKKRSERKCFKGSETFYHIKSFVLQVQQAMFNLKNNIVFVLLHYDASAFSFWKTLKNYRLVMEDTSNESNSEMVIKIIVLGQ